MTLATTDEAASPAPATTALPPSVAFLVRWPLTPQDPRRLAFTLSLATLLQQVWAAPTVENAKLYVASLADGARMRAGRDRPVALEPCPCPPLRFGRWLVDASWGLIDRARALLGRDPLTGEYATIKLQPRLEGPTVAWLGSDLPATFLKVYECGGDSSFRWLAREQANEALTDYLARRRGVPLDPREVAAIFTLACEGVAAMHQLRVYGWSAHAGNVFWVGDRWRLGDLGRSCILVEPGDPRLGPFESWLAAHPEYPASALLGWPGDERVPCGFSPCSEDRSRRLRQDDCSMLGGLLVDLLGLDRWSIFRQALTTTLLCSGTYRLTGNRRLDVPLSAILNRCWRGEGGGAPLTANDGKGEPTVYDDAAQLGRDVAAILAPRRGRPGAPPGRAFGALTGPKGVRGLPIVNTGGEGGHVPG